jgi:hypothetical protein
MFRLTVKGPSGAESHVWDRDELLVGRGEGANLRIDDPAASRNHCVLRVEGGKVLLVDLGSANGISVGGAKVREAHLGPGGEFSIGRTTFRVDAYTGSGLALEPARPAVRAGPRRAPVPSGVEPDFSREIRAMVRKAPWYLISLFVHAVLLLLLDLVAFRSTAVSFRGHIVAVQAHDASMAAERLERFEPVVEPLPESLQELEEFPMEDLRSREEAEAEAFAVPEESPDRREIGTGATLATRIRPLKISPVVKEGAPGVDTSDLDGEHRRAQRTVETGMGDRLGGLAGLPRDNIVVIRGDFDRMEAILDLYKVPYTLLTTDELLAHRPARMKVLCINCMRAPEGQARKRKLAETVRAFVQGGGWLITSDWAVDPFLTLAFPMHVRLAPPARTNRDTTVAVTPVRVTSPLLEGVFERRLETKWWLEDSSRFVTVDGDRVEVLVTSEEMRARYGSDVVVFQFGAGRGRVLHLLGHFYQKDGTITGLAAMQRLILNFLSARFLE